MEKWRKFPYTIEEHEKLPEKWQNFENMKAVSENGSVYRVPKYYSKAAEGIYNFKVRPDDIWVLTFPRSGTTLTQEMVWLIVNDDYEWAKREPLIRRFPFLEATTRLSEEELEKAKNSMRDDDKKLKDFNEVMSNHWITLENKVGRRFIKSHLHFDLLPPDLLTSGCKIIYVARNPKDVAVSCFKFAAPNVPDEDFPELFELFQNDALVWTPYWNHVIQGWNNRNRENVCFIFYEDMTKDMKTTIRRVANFLKKDMTEGQVDKLAEHLNIGNFRENKSITKFHIHYILPSTNRQIVRNGQVGGWRAHFNDDLNKKANKWIEENYKNTDLRFPVSLD